MVHAAGHDQQLDAARPGQRHGRIDARGQAGIGRAVDEGPVAQHQRGICVLRGRVRQHVRAMARDHDVDRHARHQAQDGKDEPHPTPASAARRMPQARRRDSAAEASWAMRSRKSVPISAL